MFSCLQCSVFTMYNVTVSLQQETKPSGDGGEKKDGEYIKLKVIGQVREEALYIKELCCL